MLKPFVITITDKNKIRSSRQTIRSLTYRPDTHLVMDPQAKGPKESRREDVTSLSDRTRGQRLTSMVPVLLTTGHSTLIKRKLFIYLGSVVSWVPTPVIKKRVRGGRGGGFTGIGRKYRPLVGSGRICYESWSNRENGTSVTVGVHRFRKGDPESHPSSKRLVTFRL